MGPRQSTEHHFPQMKFGLTLPVIPKRSSADAKKEKSNKPSAQILGGLPPGPGNRHSSFQLPHLLSVDSFRTIFTLPHQPTKSLFRLAEGESEDMEKSHVTLEELASSHSPPTLSLDLPSEA